MEKDIIANIKSLAIDMIDKAGSGHPGIVLSAAPILYTVYANHINVKPISPYWPNRDRFVLSAGHGSALLYATLFMAGFISLDDLKEFRTIGSKTPGHPEYGKTPGVDMTTGPLGQGFASAVGMAIGEKNIEDKFQMRNKSLVNYNIYVLCGDGDLMEGISYEAASIAGNLKLNNLIVLYDSNKMSLDGNTNFTFTENVRERFEALGWNTILVKDGTKIADINKAINKAKVSELPTLIEISTILGKDSLLENTNTVHGKPLTKEDITQLKKKLEVPDKPFYVNNNAKNVFQTSVNHRGNKKYEIWCTDYKNYIATKLMGDAKPINDFFLKRNSINLFNIDFDLKEEELRISNNRVMNEIAHKLDDFIGGSADLSSSTKTYLENMGNFTAYSYKGKNIWFGVREHAMGAILNGLALTGFKPFGSTFLTFADYLKPSMRISALMKLPVTYIFTHDTIAVGPDGPTHQPIEQISMIRDIPNMYLFRPADMNEVIGSWQTILDMKITSTLVISKEKTPILKGTNKMLVQKGAYIIKKEKYMANATLIATGTDVNLIIQIAEELFYDGVDVRIISMPCMELFNRQTTEYKQKILSGSKRIIFIEASLANGYERIPKIGVKGFGISGSKIDVLEYMSFDKETIKNRIKKMI